jgi:hypothetical protein
MYQIRPTNESVDFHRAKWFWSRFLIFLPGPLVFCAGFAQAYPEIAPFIWVVDRCLLFEGKLG